MPSKLEPGRPPRRSLVAALTAAAVLLLPGAARATVRTDAESVRRAVEEVFSDPAMRAAGSHGGGVTILEYIQLHAMKLFAELMEFFAELSEENPAFFYIIFGALALVLLLLLAHIAWTLSLAFRGAKPGAGVEEGAPDSAADRARRFRLLEQEARALAAAGSYREAIRMLLLALLSLVEERRILTVSRGWTNREILARLRLGEERAALAESFAGTFDRAWYGGEAGGREDFDRCAGFVGGMAGVLAAPRHDGRR